MELPENFDLLSFVIEQIPFILIMLLLVYFFFIRPARKRKRMEDKMYYTFIGDELLMDDGMVGRFIGVRDDKIVTLESGSTNSKFTYDRDFISENVTSKERVAEYYKSLDFWHKILYKF